MLCCCCCCFGFFKFCAMFCLYCRKNFQGHIWHSRWQTSYHFLNYVELQSRFPILFEPYLLQRVSMLEHSPSVKPVPSTHLLIGKFLRPHMFLVFKFFLKSLYSSVGYFFPVIIPGNALMTSCDLTKMEMLLIRTWLQRNSKCCVCIP